MVTDAHFERATASPALPESTPETPSEKALQYTSVRASNGQNGSLPDSEKTPDLLGLTNSYMNVHEFHIPPTGFEPVYAD